MIKTLILCLLLAAGQAQAATAYLVSCNTGQSVTGRFIYIGTYQYSGNYFERVFTSWCPSSVEVF